MRDWMDDGAPYVKVLNARTPVAAKPYLCDICGKTIEKGSRYVMVAQLIDGAFAMFRAHELRGDPNIARCPE